MSKTDVSNLHDKNINNSKYSCRGTYMKLKCKNICGGDCSSIFRTGEKGWNESEGVLSCISNILALKKKLRNMAECFECGQPAWYLLIVAFYTFLYAEIVYDLEGKRSNHNGQVSYHVSSQLNPPLLELKRRENMNIWYMQKNILLKNSWIHWEN